MKALQFTVEAGDWESVNKRLQLVIKFKQIYPSLDIASDKYDRLLHEDGYGHRSMYIMHNNIKYLVLKGSPYVQLTQTNS